MPPQGPIDRLISRFRRQAGLDRRHMLIRVMGKGRSRDGRVAIQVSDPEVVAPLRAFLARHELALRAQVLPRAGRMPGVRGVVNVAVAPLRSAADHRAEVVTEVLLGNALPLLDRAEDFYLARATDGYLGWVEKRQVVPQTADEAAAWDARAHIAVRTQQAAIRDRPRAGAMVCRTATVGSTLPVLRRRGGWARVLLPDGVAGWLRRGGEFSLGRPATVAGLRRRVCETARRFLGVPYVWGGRSPLGFDCSGLTQCVYGLSGLTLPRDADQQAAEGDDLGDDLSRCRPGDLLFFGGRRVMHVGLYVGRGIFIHAQGFVRQNSLQHTYRLFHSGLARTFLFARSIIGATAAR